MFHRSLIALLFSASMAAPAQAAEHFICDVIKSCTVERSCTESETLFDLYFHDQQTVEVNLGGTSRRLKLDPESYTVAWRDGWTTYQMFLPGDGAGILTVVPDGGGRFERIMVQRVHCGPA